MEVADGDKRRSGPQLRQWALRHTDRPAHAGCTPVAAQPIGRGDREQPGF
jgi:hypothetical protein